MPIMLGVDHSATGAVITALSENLGSENLGVLVLDQHFDGLPLSLRMERNLLMQFGLTGNATNPASEGRVGENYCCGNFWKHLMDAGTVLPENLFFLGVADYPLGEPIPGWERFRESYLGFEAKGCRFFPLQAFEGEYVRLLRAFLSENIKTTNVYVSLDLDVGAQRCVHAARYMDWPGMEKKDLMNVARLIREFCQSGRFRLVGLDVMEFNMHFLGLEMEGGIKDETASVAVAFINQLIARDGCTGEEAPGMNTEQ